MKRPSKPFHLVLALVVLLLWGTVLRRSHAAGLPGTISAEPSGRYISVADGQSNLVLRLNLEYGCKLDRVVVRGRQVLSSASGAYTGVQVSNQWFTTATQLSQSKVKVRGNGVTVSDICYGGEGV